MGVVVGFKHVRDVEPRPFWRGAVLTSRNTSLPRYRAEFGRSKSNRMGVGKVSKIWENRGPAPRDGGMADPLETRVLPTGATMPNLVVLGQTVRTYLPRLVGWLVFNGTFSTKRLHRANGVLLYCAGPEKTNNKMKKSARRDVNTARWL